MYLIYSITLQFCNLELKLYCGQHFFVKLTMLYHTNTVTLKILILQVRTQSIAIYEGNAVHSNASGYV